MISSGPSALVKAAYLQSASVGKRYLGLTDHEVVHVYVSLAVKQKLELFVLSQIWERQRA